MNHRKFAGWRAQFEFKLADLWIGAFWKRQGNCIDLWICFLPCVPLHVSWWWTRERVMSPLERRVEELKNNEPWLGPLSDTKLIQIIASRDLKLGEGGE